MNYMEESLLYLAESLKLLELKEKMPKKIITNENATIVIWQDETKTIMKLHDGDEYDKRLAVLIAFFQKYSGLSKNQANKFLDSLMEAEKFEKYTIDNLPKINDIVKVTNEDNLFYGEIGRVLEDDATPYVKFNDRTWAIPFCSLKKIEERK